MGLARKLLGENEVEVIHTRTHAKVLAWPALLFLILCFAVGAVLGVLTPRLDVTVRPWAVGAVWIVALVVVLAGCVAPFLRWWTTTYTITNRRLITRKGILNRTGHDLPLARINDVSYDRSLIDRMLGCGSLTLTTAAEQPVTLHDIPQVEKVHLDLTELLFGAHQPDTNPAP